MPPHLLNRHLQQVRTVAGWQDPVRQAVTGQTVGLSKWESLALKGGETWGGFQTPAVRTEQVTARLRGNIKATEKLAVGHVLAILPKRFRPKASIDLVTVSSASVQVVLITAAGEVQVALVEVPLGGYFLLDGLTYNLT